VLIGINAKALSEKNPTGVAEYARKLLTHMLMLPEAKAHHFLFYAESVPDLLLPENVTLRVLHAPYLWTQARLGWELWRRTPDMFFTPQHVLPLTAPKNSVATIHGLEFERYPSFYSSKSLAYLRGATQHAVKNARRIIAVSAATKRDLMELYGAPESRITVVHHGCDVGDPPRRTKGGKPFFLYIGRIEKKKNVDGIVRAFEIAKEKFHLPHALVLAGSDGHGSEHIKPLIANSRYKRHIRNEGYIAEEEKRDLLRQAEAFVFPSWYEGFGLPVLEAQAAGTPVITSRHSSLEEVAGNAALYADPASPQAIAEAMRIVAGDAELRRNLVSLGKENAMRFSWGTCAKETLQVLTG